MKQNIRELRFATKSKHPLLQNFANSISPYAWRKLEGELKIMKTQYDFIFNEVTQPITIFYSNFKIILRLPL
jgi:hypothetical protein